MQQIATLAFSTLFYTVKMAIIFLANYTIETTFAALLNSLTYTECIYLSIWKKLNNLF